ncbi:bacteriophage Gp15 family protein [uncultured Clostridium sp.]|uniref:bacteriophage Gp15 family protein n=1 Tax=uncultured Clostridium sp. TaxID=59620 RepID=UPI0026366ECA|nr:bacteriophage Gp15 family protein [uncultured Clostridium sp.]
MFSLLLDRLPTKVTIDSKEYRINSNFRNSILFELMMLDDELTEEEKITTALNLYYPVIPNNLNKAIDEIIKFYSCGFNENSSNNTNSNRTYNDVYNFEYDSDYIYSAFMDQYNIDLNSIEYLHWWKFKAMFKSLKEDNLISKIISYRSINLSEIQDDDERARYKNLKDLYKLPNKYEKEDDKKLKEIESILMNKDQ